MQNPSTRSFQSTVRVPGRTNPVRASIICTFTAPFEPLVVCVPKTEEEFDFQTLPVSEQLALRDKAQNMPPANTAEQSELQAAVQAEIKRFA